MPSEWLRRHRKDQYHRLAQERGYRSRAYFKLDQIARRYRFIKGGDRVLDLGAAPGGWLQAASRLVGSRGYVLGLDKQSIEPLRFDNVDTLATDITENDIIERVRACSAVPFDVVLADLSPNVSGVWEVDHARQIDLARHALRLASHLLKERGNMLVKVFQGSELKEFEMEMKSHFQALRIVKPPASRAESAELYLLGLDFKCS